MEKKHRLTQILAIVGTILLWLPMIAPVIFGLIRYIQGRRFLFDYLAPAELFPVVLLGGGLLLWAAIRARSRREIIGWGLAAAVVLLIGVMVLAQVTGLDSGAAEEGGWQWSLVLVLMAGFWLALMGTGIGGVLLACDFTVGGG